MKLTLNTFILLFFSLTIFAQKEYERNYDESKVPVFDLPESLITFKGDSIKTIADWTQIRRPELFSFFEENVYGKIPGTIDDISFEVVEQGDNAINDKAIRKQVKITITKNNQSLSYTVLIYLPKANLNAPLFLGPNFRGNHTVNKDPNIIITNAWVPNTKELGITDHKAKTSSRGTRTNRWAIDKIIDGGFGLATIYYGEVDPDKNDFSDGLHQLFYNEGQKNPNPGEWGSISAWAFALSSTLDYFETDPAINASKVVVFGHSRLGKTSLWAGASDKRFAGVISNDSGCGGAALSKRKYGETIAIISTAFPHWFSDNFNRYIENEAALPVDQHQLLALIAPRPLYVASAQEDQWADPKGEFLSAHYASTVYDLFDKEGIKTDVMPQANNPIQNTVAYHIRTGKHDVTDYDWEQYIKWAKKFIE